MSNRQRSCRFHRLSGIITVSPVCQGSDFASSPQRQKQINRSCCQGSARFFFFMDRKKKSVLTCLSSPLRSPSERTLTHDVHKQELMNRHHFNLTVSSALWALYLPLPLAPSGSVLRGMSSRLVWVEEESEITHWVCTHTQTHTQTAEEEGAP